MYLPHTNESPALLRSRFLANVKHKCCSQQYVRFTRVAAWPILIKCHPWQTVLNAHRSHTAPSNYLVARSFAVAVISAGENVLSSSIWRAPGRSKSIFVRLIIWMVKPPYVRT